MKKYYSKICLIAVYLIITFNVCGQNIFSGRNVVSNNIGGGSNLYITDIDGDNDLDVVLSSSYADKIAWYENLGGGVFSLQKIITTAINEPISVSAADVDNDGDSDIIFGSEEDRGVFFCENLGNGIFSSPSIIYSNDYPHSILTVDIDSDGDIDILTAGSARDVFSDGELILSINSGNGTFTYSSIANSNNDNNIDHVKSVIAGDLDNDGDLDILCSSKAGGKGVIMYENLGNQTFANSVIISHSLEKLSIDIGDIDNDGDMDIVKAIDYYGRIFWIENLGSGIFSPQHNQLIRSSNWGYSLATADLDCDGDLDILSTRDVSNNSPVDKVGWFKNLGNGDFSLVSYIDQTLNYTPKVYTADLDGDNDIDVLSIDRSTLVWYENQIGKVTGNVYYDINQNGERNQNEFGLNRQLTIQPGNIIINSDTTGFWSLDSLPSGTYSIELDTTGGWIPTGTFPQYFTVIHPDSCLITPSLGLVSASSCSHPHISIHAPFLRPGFQQRIYVQVCNEYYGTGSMDSIYVLVELDSLLTLDSTSIVHTNLGNNQYQFFFADSLNPGECINFFLSTTLSNVAILGQSLCMSAELFPIDSCALDTVVNAVGIRCISLYDESHLRIQSRCMNNDSLSFTITNIGAHMTCFTETRLYIDGELISIDPIHLYSGQDTIFTFLADGRTWRMEVDQHPLHPGNSQPSTTIELCGDETNWTPNLVNTLPQNDFDPMIDIFCGEVRGSYDPNDKTGFPLGVGSAHNILPNQKLEYLIRFQNTGTDTAFTIVIRDTLSTDFNLFSVKSGVASHNYTFRKYGPRVLEWTFSNIMLPDSNVNEPLSNGFVKFEVQQKPNLSNGTLLENSAAIYFDFNAPIITNTSLHTINRNVSSFVNINKVAIEKALQIKVYPNPTFGLLHIERQTNEALQIVVVDQLGRVVHSQRVQEMWETIDLTYLSTGIYFLSMSNGKEQFSFKVVKH